MDDVALRPRRVHPLCVQDIGDSPFKVYAMAADPAGPEPSVVKAALASLVVPAPDGEPLPGFVLVHEARPAVFVLWHRWVDALDLQLGYHRAPHSTPGALSAVDGGRVGCVWELAVVAFERAAWWRHVASRSAPDHGAYLADAMDGWTDE